MDFQGEDDGRHHKWRWLLETSFEPTWQPDDRITGLLPNVPYNTFEYVWDEPGTRYLGVLAQDLQRVVPDAVYNDDGYLLIDEAALKQIMELKKFDIGSSGYAK